MTSEQDVAFYRENGYLVVREVLSRTEVEELRLTIGTHDDVRRLDVAVDDTLPMRMLHGAGDLQEQSQP